MNTIAEVPTPRGTHLLDAALVALAAIAGHYQIAVDPAQLHHDLALGTRLGGHDDIVIGARRVGLKARAIAPLTAARLNQLPLPAIVRSADGAYAILAASRQKDRLRLIDPVLGKGQELSLDEILAWSDKTAVLVTRRFAGAGAQPRPFGLRWFLPSIWRYRRALADVAVASFFVQVFGLVTPLFFQLVVDKVLVHQGGSTLLVIVVGMLVLGLFEGILDYLRTYTLAHTTNRMDVELGRRLFAHLFRLPLAYFETRPAGQTVARMRELETIRNFLTGQGLTAALDLVFALIFIAVLFSYSVPLTLVVLASVPIYVGLALVIRPMLRERINEKFDRGAKSQQFLVESVVGAQTLKAASVEPMMQMQWEERLAAYVGSAFGAAMLGTVGQTLVRYVSKVTTVVIIFLGARAVIDGHMTVGQLIAFNMIAGQVVQPVLRLSQLWQDVQQVQVSVERLGDILNAPVERAPAALQSLPPLRGAIRLKNVSFRYRPAAPAVLRDIDLEIRPGEVLGIVGPSGSGKSTLTKLVQRLVVPDEGQVLVDGTDVSQLDPGWLRRQIGVVLQDNVLFARTIHENIALANPGLPRSRIMQVADLAGAHPFIAALPQGYDTPLEERGSNLSGGQRQRIAIARALATDPRILIFDEATSALDYESERLIQHNMRAIVRDRTVIIIAHRLAAVRGCDRIIAIDRGRIVEQGSHGDLLANPEGIYARLWALQNQQVLA